MSKNRWRTSRGGAACCALLVVAVAAFPSAASADAQSLLPVGAGSVNPLDPNPVATATPLAAALPSNEIFSCNQPYGWVANVPSGYITGNCLSGVHLHRLDQITLADGTKWNGGQVFGSYNGCGWMKQTWNDDTGSTGSNNCVPGSVGYSLSQFAASTNDGAAAAGGQAALDCATNSSGHCTDGSNVSVKTSCQVYANFRPWAAGQGLTNAIVSPPGTSLATGLLSVGLVVKWRYVAKYVSSSGITYVMIHVLNVPSGQGNWGFVNKNCLNALPYVTGV